MVVGLCSVRLGGHHGSSSANSEKSAVDQKSFRWSKFASNREKASPKVPQTKAKGLDDATKRTLNLHDEDFWSSCPCLHEPIPNTMIEDKTPYKHGKTSKNTNSKYFTKTILKLKLL